eukprot:1617099-Ditylum_brightwellii.AAC.1
MLPYKFNGNDALQPAALCVMHQTTCACNAPKYKLCRIANCHQQSPTATYSLCNPESNGVLKIGDVTPGNKISTGQYESRYCSCLPNTFGKELESSKYCGGTIFAGHISTYL